MRRRILVEQALDKASEYEKQGNISQAEKFLALAERADKVYDKIENGEIDILKTGGLK